MSPIPNLHSFDPLSLDELNIKADMLTRVDNKYIVNGHLCSASIKLLKQHFDVLTIDRKRSFGYENIYFDDEDGICFHQHRQGKRQKFKARTRVYLDSKDLAYFEVKLAGKGRIIDKYRIPCKLHEHGMVTNQFAEFLKQQYAKQYKRTLDFNLLPTVKTAYQRITLVAKKGGERLTIDHNLSLGLKDTAANVPAALAIFETKSKNGNGIADKILRSESIPRVKGCSKFCLSMALSGQVRKYNKFLPVIRQHFSELQPAERHTEFRNKPESEHRHQVPDMSLPAVEYAI
ncbi:MAG: polyphosphate polymerase domain-containing protein [Gammaproteobacteria bacterium]|nr:polyphosphate polymerase domain-containing protein [Gammaproteobacteria bacterium]